MKILSALCMILCIPATISMTTGTQAAFSQGTPGGQVAQPYANPSTTGPGTSSTAQQQIGAQQQQYNPGTPQQYTSGTPQQYTSGTPQQYTPGTQQQYIRTPQQQQYAYVPQYGVQQPTYPVYYNTPQYGSPYQQFQQTYSDYNQVYSQPQYYNPNAYYSYPPRRQVSQQNFYNDPTTAWMVMESGNDMMANVYGMRKYGVPLNALDINMDALILGDLMSPRSSGRSAARQRGQSSALFSPLNTIAWINALQ